jgi:hypothetical protein
VTTALESGRGADPGRSAAEGDRVVDQLQAVAVATRFLVTHEPDARFREVWARLDEGRWWVSFGKVFAPGVAESPGGWCVTVDVRTGRPAWFQVL